MLYISCTIPEKLFIILTFVDPCVYVGVIRCHCTVHRKNFPYFIQFSHTNTWKRRRYGTSMCEANYIYSLCNIRVYNRVDMVTVYGVACVCVGSFVRVHSLKTQNFG